MLDSLKIAIQFVIPQHLLSRLMHRFMQVRLRWFKNLQIRMISRIYQVNLEEALDADPDSYPTFNAFFTRQLKDGVRPVASEGQVACPADGKISAIGDIQQDRLIQAKGHDYSLQDLLAGRDDLAHLMQDGFFATIYLSPRDYHRVHMPLAGRLQEMIYVPGRLFSVNDVTTRHVERLFARNERVISVFETDAGPVIQILVGAIFVGSMETVWDGQITPPYGKKIISKRYQDIPLQHGAEMGRFNMGSTVIMLFPRNSIEWDSCIKSNTSVQCGQSMGRIRQD